MNINKIYHKIWFSLLHTVRIQIFINLVSLPILVFWGLPSSILSIPGNIIFAPFLALFLLISLFIFLCELINIPNQWLIWLLEKQVHLWSKTGIKSKFYLFSFPQITWIVFTLALMCVIYIILRPKTSLQKQVFLMAITFASSFVIAKSPVWVGTQSITLTYRKQKMKIRNHYNKLVIDDYGTLNYKFGTENWINFTLAPALTKHFGSLTVNELTIHKPNQNTDINIELMQENLNICKTTLNLPNKPT